MGQTPDQIESHIRIQREGLQANLKELEDKVKSATDWRQQFSRHPGIFIAAALGVGVLLSAVVRTAPRRRGSAPFALSAPVASSEHFPGGVRGAALEVWHSVRAALIAVAVTKIQSVVMGTVRRHSERAARAHSTHQT